MAGVAEQGRIADCPLRQQITAHQSPFEQARRRGNKRLHILMPPSVVFGALLGSALGGPRLDLPVAAFLDADEIHEPAGAQRIMDHVTADPDPVGGFITADTPRHPVDWDHAAPSDHAKKPRIVAAEQLSADHRMDPVGADEGLACGGGAVFEPQQYFSAALGHPDCAPAEMDCFRPPCPDGIDEHLQKVGAEDGDVRKSVALDRLGAEIE